MPAGGAFVETSVGEIANLTGLEVPKAKEVVDKLVGSKLVEPHEEGYIVPEPQKLHKFLEYLAMKEQFGDFS